MRFGFSLSFKLIRQDTPEFLSSEILVLLHCLQSKQFHLNRISYKSVLLTYLSFELISAKGKIKKMERSLIFEGAYSLFDPVKVISPPIHLF